MAAIAMAVDVLMSLTEDSNRQLKIFWQLEILWVAVLVSVMAVARPGVISSGSEPFLKTMAGRRLDLPLMSFEDQEDYEIPDMN